MAPVDGGGLPVFEGERARDCMGIALYTRAYDGAVFAIVSRSEKRIFHYYAWEDIAGTDLKIAVGGAPSAK